MNTENGYEALTRKVKEFRKSLTNVHKNEKTYVLYESVNNLFDEDLDELGLTIVDLATIVMDEIENNPFIETKENILH
jgi:hypothetical protein